ncbi:hypothetical protein B0H11DRAFT_1902503 [Mycena galericulata]|nr:hypothetical protein B0H11DRAFT_1902503 [Mycena galericulata]
MLGKLSSSEKIRTKIITVSKHQAQPLPLLGSAYIPSETNFGEKAYKDARLTGDFSRQSCQVILLGSSREERVRPEFLRIAANNWVIVPCSGSAAPDVSAVRPSGPTRYLPRIEQTNFRLQPAISFRVAQGRPPDRPVALLGPLRGERSPRVPLPSGLEHRTTTPDGEKTTRLQKPLKVVSLGRLRCTRRPRAPEGREVGKALAPLEDFKMIYGSRDAWRVPARREVARSWAFQTPSYYTWTLYSTVTSFLAVSRLSLSGLACSNIDPYSGGGSCP